MWRAHCLNESAILFSASLGVFVDIKQPGAILGGVVEV